MSRKRIKSDFSPSGSKVKIKFKNHILPPLIGFSTMLLCLGFFNSQLIAGKISHASYKENLDSSVTYSQHNADSLVAESTEPRLIINKLNVIAPVNYSLNEVDERDFQIALRDGVVHYPGTGIPGQPGNIVIFGHSSNQVWAKGNYKFIFSTLDKLDKEDTIVLEYEGNKYIYKVIGQKVVKPTDLSVLSATNKHKLTLITCTPVGSNTNRLIIEAEQIAPLVESSNQDNENLPKETEELFGKKQLPGNSNPSLWESIKSIF